MSGGVQQSYRGRGYDNARGGRGQGRTVWGRVTWKELVYVPVNGVQEVDITRHYLVFSHSKLVVRFNLTLSVVIYKINKWQKGVEFAAEHRGLGLLKDELCVGLEYGYCKSM